MPVSVTVRDETLTGEKTNELSLDFLTERITVRELIRSRVYQEVKDHNTNPDQGVFRGLVQPSDTEQAANGYRLKKPRQIDWNEQFEKATEAFERSQVLILVNERQVETLDEEIEVAADTDIAFLRLTLLVGG